MFDIQQVGARTQKLAVDLSGQFGISRVIDDPDILASMAGDKSHCAPAMPHLAIRVRTEEEIGRVLVAAQQHRVPVTPRGAGTGKSGGAIPICGGLILDLSKMTDTKEIDRRNLLAVVEPGVITGAFQQAVEREGLFYPPDPNSLESCTLGGNVAHNAGGPRAFKYGVTREYVLGTRTVLPDGNPVTTGRRTVKGVAGYDITGLLVGSEGTLGVFTAVTLRLIRRPTALATLLIAMPSEEKAGDAVSSIVAAGIVPRVLEFMDRGVVDVLRAKGVQGVSERTGALILAEVDGLDEALVERDAVVLSELCDRAGADEVFMARHGTEREKLWAARRLMSDAIAETARHKASEDIVVPRSAASALLAGLKRLEEKWQVRMACYGHAGDGNYHVNILWNDEDFCVDGAVSDLFDLTLSLQGTITGEHGVGLSKKAYLPKEQSAALIALQRSVKAAIDPQGILNPGKIF